MQNATLRDLIVYPKLLLFAGFVYGAKENKMLQVFIDDLNLPTPDEHGVQRCNEVSTFIVVYHKFTM